MRNQLRDRFSTIVAVLRQQENFSIEDLDTQISNALADYERTTSDRLAFLREQAAIARQLNIEQNTIEAQSFTTLGGVIANLNAEVPFYARGYKAIEKEIELIQSRENTRAFVSGLRALETEKRALEQSVTLDRAERLFKLTPVDSEEEFRAMRFIVQATEFDYRFSRAVLFLMFLGFGLLLGVMLVFFRQAVLTVSGRSL